MRASASTFRMMIPVLALALAAAGCGSDGDQAEDATTTTAQDGDTTTPSTTSGLDRDDRDSGSVPDRITTTTTATVTGEVPSGYLQPVIEDAASLAGVEPSTVTVVTAQEMLWPDGSLGCPEPGVNYTMAEVPGYWVIVEAGGAAYDYRLTGNGTFRYCANPFGAPGGTAPTE